MNLKDIFTKIAKNAPTSTAAVASAPILPGAQLIFLPITAAADAALYMYRKNKSDQEPKKNPYGETKGPISDWKK